MVFEVTKESFVTNFTVGVGTSISQQSGSYMPDCGGKADTSIAFHYWQLLVYSDPLQLLGFCVRVGSHQVFILHSYSSSGSAMMIAVDHLTIIELLYYTVYTTKLMITLEI